MPLHCGDFHFLFLHFHYHTTAATPTHAAAARTHALHVITSRLHTPRTHRTSAVFALHVTVYTFYYLCSDIYLPLYPLSAPLRYLSCISYLFLALFAFDGYIFALPRVCGSGQDGKVVE